MQVEIERKFLIRNAGWRDGVRHSRHITDYLIAQFEGGKARMRLCDDTAMLTFKGNRRGTRRCEYHIPLAEPDARAMVRDLVTTPPIEKRRHDVVVAGLVWQVDEYVGPLHGFVTTDAELPHEDHALVLPDWVGREITGDQRFGASAVAAAAHQGPQAVRALMRAAAVPA
ncbi:CYTH domain-containing protein [Falsirhodobacter sp. 20TX0035]|uniref:CYTH domain-containing protein n=1 Tax=Falsirhodobacter sp. 20TX0035 TaxID=3022019 RepID=UPI00232ED2E3|nr:CYTH domain-containing protein [Falsirhodobacter sp. 20TX0035]MDB6454054.1 hypothetical protein [Falsirhodobacter sp. 20TX0035]